MDLELLNELQLREVNAWWGSRMTNAISTTKAIDPGGEFPRSTICKAPTRLPDMQYVIRSEQT